MDLWASARKFFKQGGAPGWVVADEDAARLQAYALYENIYRIAPDTFKLMQRGQEEDPIYLPGPRKLIETVNRFLAKDWNYIISPNAGSPEEQASVGMLMGKLFRREKMYSTFAMQKRWGLVRGDAIWHVFADPNKTQGSRISIKSVDPSNYFPIVDDNDATRVIGVHLMDVVIDPSDAAGTKQVARVQTYRKTDNGRITSELNLFKLDKWDDRNLPPNKIEKIATVNDLFELPEQITSLPVYHISNSPVPGKLWGSSQLQGVERVLAAINQSITDEDLALVLQGLGMYVTNAGPPKNSDGTTGVWDLGPGQVIEGMGADFKFERVNGITSVTPSLDHIRYMAGETESSMGISDIAAGRVDVTVAESGISLQMQLAPLLEANAEKEQDILGISDHMLYDISHGWFPAFEELPSDIAVEVVSTCGDAMPQNREAEIRLVMELVSNGLLSLEEGRIQLVGLGMEIDDTNTDEIIRETQAMALAKNADPFLNRYSSEFDKLDGKSGNTPSPSSAANGVVIPGTVA